MRSKTYFRIAAMAAIFILVSSAHVFAGGSPQVSLKGEIAVGSKIDTEGALLGNIIAILLEDQGYKIIDRIGTGPTPVVREAIASGEIDIYPEYTGNGFYFFAGQSSEDLWKNPTSAWETVKRLDYEANRIVWLRSAPANNTWAIAIRGDLAAAENLRSLDDLAAYIGKGGNFKIAGSEEFFSSTAAMPSFEAAYGFKLAEDQILVLSSGNTALTEQAAARGTDGVNAAMAYGTDGQLAALSLVVMEDTRGVQPVYEPAPIIREEVLKAHPEIAEILEPVFASLDLVTLQNLNSKIAVDGENPAKVAGDYLRQEGFL